MIRSWLIFGYIWYFHYFSFQNISYLRNGNKLVVRILWLQDQEPLKRHWLQQQAGCFHDFPGQERPRLSQGPEQERNAIRNPGSILSVSCFHCAVLLESPISAHHLFQVFLPLEEGWPLHSSHEYILHSTSSPRCATVSQSHSKF